MHRSVAVAVCAVSLGGLMEVGGLTPPPLAVATCTARRRLPCAPHDAGRRLDAATPGGRHVHRSEAVAVCAVTPGQRPLVGVLWSASSGRRPLVGRNFLNPIFGLGCWRSGVRRV